MWLLFFKTDSMKQLSRILSSVLIGSMLLVSCRQETVPDGIMDHDAMVGFLTEAYMLEGFYAVESGFRYGNMSDEAQQSYEALLDSFHVTKAQFDSSIAYYTRHELEYEEIHEQVMNRLESLPE